jgi:membrane fusion protein, multidrug efflux system
MKRRLLALGVAFLIALAGELMGKLMLGRATADGAAAKTSSNAHPVPVTVGLAERGNIPVYLTGLGTVQAFNTVTVNSRVDGELTKAAFNEGQNVKAGDVLAQIDPRSFQAALALASA